MTAPLRPVRGREFQLLAEAHRARNKGRNRAAIRLYKKILIENPQNLDVALRVAPMLAMAGESFEAWQLYRRAALDYAKSKDVALICDGNGDILKAAFPVEIVAERSRLTVAPAPALRAALNAVYLAPLDS